MLRPIIPTVIMNNFLLMNSESLENSHETVVSPDKIHYQLSKSSKECLLRLLKVKLELVQFPVSWTQATVITIPKPGKDNINPNIYLPLALTSCVCL